MCSNAEGRFGNCAATIFRMASSVLGELDNPKGRTRFRGSPLMLRGSPPPAARSGDPRPRVQWPKVQVARLYRERQGRACRSSGSKAREATPGAWKRNGPTLAFGRSARRRLLAHLHLCTWKGSGWPKVEVARLYRERQGRACRCSGRAGSPLLRLGSAMGQLWVSAVEPVAAFWLTLEVVRMRDGQKSKLHDCISSGREERVGAREGQGGHSWGLEGSAINGPTLAFGRSARRRLLAHLEKGSGGRRGQKSKLHDCISSGREERVGAWEGQGGPIAFIAAVCAVGVRLPS